MERELTMSKLTKQKVLVDGVEYASLTRVLNKFRLSRTEFFKAVSAGDINCELVKCNQEVFEETLKTKTKQIERAGKHMLEVAVATENKENQLKLTEFNNMLAEILADLKTN